jgi:tetratricopeptide (TPR) repeat protein
MLEGVERGRRLLKRTRPAPRAVLLTGTIAVVALGAAPAAPAAAVEEGRQAAIDAFRSGDLQRSESLARGWLERHPGDTDIARLLGLVQISAGMALERAGRPRDEFLRVYREALDSLQTAERLGAGAPQPKLDHAIGYIFLAERRYAEAADRLSRAIELEPDAFVLYRLRGTCRLERGEYAEAAADLERARRLAPLDLASRLLSAKAFFFLGREEAALEVLRDYRDLVSVEAADDVRFQTQYEIYRYSMLLNRLEPARSALEEAAHLRPGDARCRTELGALYYRLGEPGRAALELGRVLDSPDVAPDLRRDALHYSGLIASDAERLNEARSFFERALDIEPDRADTLQQYVSVLRRLGDRAGARSAQRRLRGLVEAEQKLDRLRTRLQLDPLDEEARVGLIRALVDLGRRFEARDQLDALRRSSPSHPSLAAFERALDDAS